MHPKILVSKELDKRIEKIHKILQKEAFKKEHPDLLYFNDGSKLGVLEVKRIREFLSLKPYQAKGRVVVMESANDLTLDAQNALLKTLEEPPINSIILLGTDSDGSFLPTVLSRCEVIQLESSNTRRSEESFDKIDQLRKMRVEERFDYIESLEDKEGLFNALVKYVYHKIKDEPSLLEFAKLTLQAEAWNKSHVNHRGILEYLMFELPN